MSKKFTIKDGDSLEEVGQKAKDTNTMFSFGPFRDDLPKRYIKVGDQYINLSKDFQVLKKDMDMSSLRKKVVMPQDAENSWRLSGMTNEIDDLFA